MANNSIRVILVGRVTVFRRNSLLMLHQSGLASWGMECHMGSTSNGSWCIGIKGEMSGTVCVTFTWDIHIYIWVVYSFFFVLLFVHYCNVMVYVVYCVASGKQEKVQACLVTLWLYIILCHSLYKTTLGSLCSWKPAWSLKKRPHSMCLKPFVKMCIFVVIQIFWSLRKYREQ